MVDSIEQWRIKEYENNVYMLSQQKDAKMWSRARHVTMSSKRKFFDRLGTTDAQARTTRHADTPNVQVDHTRRAVDLFDWNWGKLVDDVDVLRNINDPTNPYAMAMSFAFKRKKDEIMRDAMLGSALTDEDGSTSVALPDAQKIASVTGSALDNLNLNALRQTKELFDLADIDPDMIRYIGVAPSQIRALLEDTTLTSSDFNTVKALVDGKVDTFMGFQFIMNNRLDLEPDAIKYNVVTGKIDAAGTSAVGGRRCIAWIPDGVILATGIDFKARISERADKNYSNQVYGEMSIGATRMEDVKVISINCAE